MGSQGEVWSTLALAPSQVPRSTSLGKKKDGIEGQEGLGELLPMEKQRDGAWCRPLALLSPLTLYTSTMEGGGLVCPLLPSGRLNPLGFLPSSLVCISLNWFIVSLLC